MVTTPRPTATPVKQKATTRPKPTATPVIPTPTSDEIDALPRAKIVMENGGEIVILLYKKILLKFCLTVLVVRDNTNATASQNRATSGGCKGRAQKRH